MPIPQSDINNWFMYHAPSAEQLVAYADIRLAAKIFAETVNKHAPDSADKTAALRKIRESMMAANQAVACNWPVPELAQDAPGALTPEGEAWEKAQAEASVQADKDSSGYTPDFGMGLASVIDQNIAKGQA